MSPTLLILKIYTTFKDVQMMLKIFFDISTGFRFLKISVECSVHLCSSPWTIQHDAEGSEIEFRTDNQKDGFSLQINSKRRLNLFSVVTKIHNTLFFLIWFTVQTVYYNIHMSWGIFPSTSVVFVSNNNGEWRRIITESLK